MSQAALIQITIKDSILIEETRKEITITKGSMLAKSKKQDRYTIKNKNR